MSGSEQITFQSQIHCVNLTVICDRSKSAAYAASQLAQDFAAWSQLKPSTLKPGKPHAKREVTLRLSGADAAPPGLARRHRAFATRMGQAFGLGCQRVIRYNANTVACLDASNPFQLEVQIHSPAPELLHEIAYVAAIALVGELLDTLSLHRVHALGFSVHGKNALCLFDEKSGKSTLALALRQYGGNAVRFFSDETPLVHGNHVLAYPTRLAIAETGTRLFEQDDLGEFRVFKRSKFPEKRLYAWKPSELAESGRIDAIFLDAKLGHPKAAITPAHQAEVFAALVRSMVVGVGVAQMAEYLLRFNARQLARLSGVAASRAGAAMKTATSSKAFRFQRSDDPRQNVQAIAGFLTDQA